jgi:hypothetical protein
MCTQSVTDTDIRSVNDKLVFQVFWDMHGEIWCRRCFYFARRESGAFQNLGEQQNSFGSASSFHNVNLEEKSEPNTA